MKSLKILLSVSTFFIPALIWAQATVMEALEDIGDEALIASYKNFQKNPTLATMSAFDMSVSEAKRNLDNEMRRDADGAARKYENAWRLGSYLQNAALQQLARVKTTKFSFPDKRADKKARVEPWSLRIEISLLRELIFANIPAYKGDFSELSIPTINGEVALNMPFDNDYISFRYMTYFGDDPRFDKRCVVSKFFEVSKFEVMAKSIETGECEFEFNDKNLDASLSFKFYNLPAVSLLPVK